MTSSGSSDTPWTDAAAQGSGGLPVQVEGELDLATAPLVQRRLEAALESPGHRVVVDLSGCVFLDSTGVDVLLEADRRARSRRVDLVVRGCSERQRRVLTLLGADHLVERTKDRRWSRRTRG